MGINPSGGGARWQHVIPRNATTRSAASRLIFSSPAAQLFFSEVAKNIRANKLKAGTSSRTAGGEEKKTTRKKLSCQRPSRATVSRRICNALQNGEEMCPPALATVALGILETRAVLELNPRKQASPPPLPSLRSTNSRSNSEIGRTDTWTHARFCPREGSKCGVLLREWKKKKRLSREIRRRIHRG